MSERLIGHAAIEYARIHGSSLNKYKDPTEGPRFGISAYEADIIAREDPSLIWLDVSPPGLDLDALQTEVEMLLSLLKDRYPGLSTWNTFLSQRLHTIKAMITEAGI